MDEKMDDAPPPTTAVLAAEKNPFEILRNSKVGVEDIVAKMLSLKKDDNPKSQLPELATQMFLHFVSLRQGTQMICSDLIELPRTLELCLKINLSMCNANRMILIEEDRVKAETDRAKAPVDSTTLQLHNLMYEKSHYLKAIKACKDFKSKYPDIELVSEEEFFREAPEEFKGTAILNDSHNLMLKRLNYELFQRKELCKLREKLEQKKKSLSETIASRKKFLSSLPSHLKALKKASLPAQSQLGNLHSKKLKQVHAADLLPPPLYIIYSQFMAQKEAFGENIELEIIGSQKEAQVFIRRQATKDTAVSAIQENTRVEDDVQDEEDDGQRRRKRPKKVVGKDNIELAGVYQAHPLKIVLHVFDDEVSDNEYVKLLTLKFEYLFKLNVVCVGIEGSDEGSEKNILCNLFPDDNGLELPQQSAKLLLEDGLVFDEGRSMRPYKWAQHLAGIDFLPEVSPMLTGNDAVKAESVKDSVVSGLSVYRQQNRVQTVVERVRSRKKTQLALAKQLDFLTDLKWPPLNCESVPWVLRKHLCDLHRWSLIGDSLSQDASSAKADMDSSVQLMDVSISGRGNISKEEMGFVTEDGELPSLTQAADPNRSKIDPIPESRVGDSMYMTLISKNVSHAVKTGKIQNSGRYEDEIDFMLDSDSEMEDTAKIDKEVECTAIGKSWVDYGTQEFSLCLARNKHVEDRSSELEAKIKISMEYPLRPPFFKLRLLSQSVSDGSLPSDHFERHNELRAIEAEVNLHICKMLPPDQENYTLSHQVHCLAMLFDLYLNENCQPSESGKCNSVIDVGLCQPVSGGLMTRSLRGRDRRKMISWKDMECTPGYPF